MSVACDASIAWADYLFTLVELTDCMYCTIHCLFPGFMAYFLSACAYGAVLHMRSSSVLSNARMFRLLQSVISVSPRAETCLRFSVAARVDATSDDARSS